MRNKLQNKLIKAKLARSEERRQYLINNYSKEPEYLPPIIDYYQRDKLSEADIAKIEKKNKKLR